MSRKRDTSWLRARQERYLTDHYISLHMTIVGLAVATAGVAAGTLIGRSDISPIKVWVLWIFWTDSLLATVAAYSGTMVGAFVMPSAIPTIADLLLPLVLGISEILMFTVLIDKISSLLQFSDLVVTWFILMAVYAIVAGLSVIMARRYFLEISASDSYTKTVKDLVSRYTHKLRSDVIGTASLAFLTALAALLQGLRCLNNLFVLIFAVGALVILIVGIYSHSRIQQMWRRSL